MTIKLTKSEKALFFVCKGKKKILFGNCTTADRLSFKYIINEMKKEKENLTLSDFQIMYVKSKWQVCPAIKEAVDKAVKDGFGSQEI